MTPNRSRSNTNWKPPPNKVLSIELKHLQAGTPLYRCHSRFLPDGQTQGSWYFSSSSGRFDLPQPKGTLNAAEQALGAVLESFSSQLVGRPWVWQGEVDKRKLVILRMQADAALADLRSSSGLKAGVVPGELTGAHANYDHTQSLAGAIHEAGRDGLAAPLRFGSAFRQDGFYIFGTSGTREDPASKELPINEVIEEMGYELVDSPTSTTITLEP